MNESELLENLAAGLGGIKLDVESGTGYENFAMVLVEAYKKWGNFDEVKTCRYKILKDGDLEIYSFVNNIKYAIVIENKRWISEGS
jgi:hypothetical protein